jgi:hypothetical protein
VICLTVVRPERLNLDSFGLARCTPIQVLSTPGQVDGNLPFSDFHSMNDLLAENLAYQRGETVVLGVLAGLALLLGDRESTAWFQS